MHFSKTVLAFIAAVGFVTAAPTNIALEERAAVSWSDFVTNVEKDAFIKRALADRSPCRRDPQNCAWSKYVRDEEMKEFVTRAETCTRDPAAQQCPWSKYVKEKEKRTGTGPCGRDPQKQC